MSEAFPASDRTPWEILEETLRQRLADNPELGQRIGRPVSLVVGGPQGGRWEIDLRRRRDWLRLASEEPSREGMRVWVEDRDLVALVSGHLRVSDALEEHRVAYLPDDPRLEPIIALLFSDLPDPGLQALEQLEVLSELRDDAAAFVPRTTLQATLFYHAELMRLRDVPGDIMEFGTHRATMLCVLDDLAALVDAPHPFRTIFGFDTFRGFPASNEMERGPEQDRRARAAKIASNTSVRLVERKLRERPRPRVRLVVGDLFETLPATLNEWPNKIAIAILDLDAAKVTHFVLENIWDRMSPGGLLCFDQYSRNGWSETSGVDRFFRERNLDLSRIKRGPRSPAAYLRV